MSLGSFAWNLMCMNIALILITESALSKTSNQVRPNFLDLIGKLKIDYFCSFLSFECEHFSGWIHRLLSLKIHNFLDQEVELVSWVWFSPIGPCFRRIYAVHHRPYFIDRTFLALEATDFSNPISLWHLKTKVGDYPYRGRMSNVS